MAASIAEVMERLRLHLVARVREGSLSERGLARMTGYSQPHMHNVLKKQRALSIEMCDRLMMALNLPLTDLVADMPLEERPSIPAWRTPVGGGNPLAKEARGKMRLHQASLVRELENPVGGRVSRGELAMWPWVQPNDEVVIDRSLRRRRGLRAEDIFLLDWLGVGVLGRCKRVGSQLLVVYENETTAADLPSRIDLTGRSELDVVVGAIAWLSRSTRQH